MTTDARSGHPHVDGEQAVDEQTRFLRDVMPLCATLGIDAVALEPGEARLSMDWDPARCTVGGALHGGALMALADSAGAAVASLNLPAGSTGTSTIESKTNFLGGVTEGTVIATARPLHLGSMTIVVETTLHAGDRLVGKVTQTQIVLRPRPA